MKRVESGSTRLGFGLGLGLGFGPRAPEVRVANRAAVPEEEDAVEREEGGGLRVVRRHAVVSQRRPGRPWLPHLRLGFRLGSGSGSGLGSG